MLYRRDLNLKYFLLKEIELMNITKRDHRLFINSNQTSTKSTQTPKTTTTNRKTKN